MLRPSLLALAASLMIFGSAAFSQETPRPGAPAAPPEQGSPADPAMTGGTAPARAPAAAPHPPPPACPAPPALILREARHLRCRRHPRRQPAADRRLAARGVRPARPR